VLHGFGQQLQIQRLIVGQRPHVMN
jgi:hypothetical protein